MSYTGHFKYNPGDLLGPYQTEMLARTHKKGNIWWGLFKCSWEHYDNLEHNFEAPISRVANGDITSCGCRKGYNGKNSVSLVGQKFGRLVVIKPTEKRCGTDIVWECQCECGKKAYVSTSALKGKRTQSCGCVQKQNLVGQKFGKLQVISLSSRNDYKKRYWVCKCDCGSIIEVSTAQLTTGHTKSCGCFRSSGEQKIANLLKLLNISFEKEKTFNGCKNKHKLRFDFYLPDYNACIEYDGIQHFTGWNNDSEQLEYCIKLDTIKDQYCKNHNIKLIRIPYYDFEKINQDYIKELLCT